MSKGRHKGKGKENFREENPMAGLNPNIMDILGFGNIDKSKISDLLSSMNNNGFDMNSINNIINKEEADVSKNKEHKGKKEDNINSIGFDFNSMGNFNNFGNLGDLSSLMGLLGGNLNGNFSAESFNNFNNINNFNKDIDMDPIVTMLISLKNFVDPQRGRFLDKVLKMYKEGKITY